MKPLTTLDLTRIYHEGRLRGRFNTVEEIADHVGTSRRSLFRYMAEGTPPKLNRSVHRNLLRLAAELGVTKSDDSIAGVFL